MIIEAAVLSCVGFTFWTLHVLENSTTCKQMLLNFINNLFQVSTALLFECWSLWKGIFGFWGHHSTQRKNKKDHSNSISKVEIQTMDSTLSSTSGRNNNQLLKIIFFLQFSMHQLGFRRIQEKILLSLFFFRFFFLFQVGNE